MKWNMKNTWGGKLTATATNANQDQASKKSRIRPPVEQEDEFPLMWHELSNQLLQSFNQRFNKFDQRFQNIKSTQQEITERLSNAENQASEREQRNTRHKDRSSRARE